MRISTVVYTHIERDIYIYGCYSTHTHTHKHHHLTYAPQQPHATHMHDALVIISLGRDGVEEGE